MTYALVINEGENRYRLFCNQCRVDLGTVNGEAMTKALILTVSRGGVMCPGCRARYCEKCGNPNSCSPLVDGVCYFCLWETEAEEDWLEQERKACLVDQKSRTHRERE